MRKLQNICTFRAAICKWRRYGANMHVWLHTDIRHLHDSYLVVLVSFTIAIRWHHHYESAARLLYSRTNQDQEIANSGNHSWRAKDILGVKRPKKAAKVKIYAIFAFCVGGPKPISRTRLTKPTTAPSLSTST